MTDFDAYYQTLSESERGIAKAAFEMGKTSMLNRVKPVLMFYGSVDHMETLKGRMDWPAERNKLRDKGYLHVVEYDDGSELFIENGSRAALCLQAIELGCPDCKGERGHEKELSSTSGTWVKCETCNGEG